MRKSALNLKGLPHIPYVFAASEIPTVNCQSFNDEHLAMIYIKRGSGQPWGYKPRHIELFNLKVTGGHPYHNFTEARGNL